MSFDWSDGLIIAIIIFSVRALWGIGLGIREVRRRSSADFLDAVVLTGSPKTLEQARRLAATVDWDSSRFIDEQNLKIWSPMNYKPSDFAALIKVLERLEDREFRLRLVNGKGNFVGPDGEEQDQM